MKLRTKIKILIFIFVVIISAFSSIINNWLKFSAENVDKGSENNDIINLDNKNLQISRISGRIHIDNNWSEAKNAGICTGQGTYFDPYVIKDMVIDSEDLGHCIRIENSTVHFKIENCKLYNAGIDGAGIYLYDVENSRIIDNDCSSNNCGIRLFLCNYNTISENLANYNTYSGIYLTWSDNNTISGNIAINNAFDGIVLDVSNHNNIYGNVAVKNKCGILLMKSIRSLLIPGCHDNTISGNIINSNSEYGIRFHSCVNNSVYLNCFTNNLIHACNEGGNNYWDNGIKGNFWSNYTGLDEDGDGIGDIPYNINGYSGGKDNYPLMKCPISVPVSPLERLILITIISGGAVIGVATILLIIRKRKRIQ